MIENIDDNENIKTAKYTNDKQDKNELNKEKNKHNILINQVK